MSILVLAAAMVLAGGPSADDSGGLALPPLSSHRHIVGDLGGVIVHANWEVGPDAKKIWKFYPNQARGVSGKVLLRCIAFVDHTVGSCYADSERPADLGFGEAAIRMAATFRMRPETFNGQPRNSKVNIPINFVGYR